GAGAGGIDRRRHAEAVVVEIAGEQVADAAVVIDDENMRRVVVGAAGAMSLDGRRHGHGPPPLPPSLSGSGEAAMMEETFGRSSALTMASRKRRTAASALGPAAFSASLRRTSCGAASGAASARPLPVGHSRRS